MASKSTDIGERWLSSQNFIDDRPDIYVYKEYADILCCDCVTPP